MACTPCTAALHPASGHSAWWRGAAACLLVAMAGAAQAQLLRADGEPGELPTPLRLQLGRLGHTAGGPLQVGFGWQVLVPDRNRLPLGGPLPALAPGEADAITGLPSRQLRVGLSFSRRDPYADFRRGTLMKLELTGQTALALRPRGGRLGLQLTSRW